MGLETAPQNPLGRIDPSSLIGRPEAVVTPQAVEALSNAVRQGFITAEDISARVRGAGATREKIKLEELLAKEGQSPEARAARAGATRLASSEIQAKEAQIKYGDAIKYFQQIAPEAGIPAPVTADGNPDYAKMAEIGSQLYSWKTQKQTARDRLTPTTWKEGLHNDKRVLLKFNASGESITPELEETLRNQAVSPFSGIQPGTTTPIPTILPNQVQSKAEAKPTLGLAGEKIPGVGMSLGPSENSEKQEAVRASELLSIDGTLRQIQSAKEIVTSKDAGDVTGIVTGSGVVSVGRRVGAAFGNKDAKQTLTDQNVLKQVHSDLVLARAQLLRGPISEKELKFLREPVPDITADPAVWKNYLAQFEVNLNERKTAFGGTPSLAPATTTASSASSPRVRGHPTDPSKVVVETPEGQYLVMTPAEADEYTKKFTSPAPQVPAQPSTVITRPAPVIPSDIPAMRGMTR